MRVEDLVKTSDGSYTLYSKKYNQAYHNIKDGALSESLQKYVIPTFKFFKKNNLNILDICFGLGFNTFATIYYVLKYDIDTKINFFSPELDKNLINSLKNFKYPEEFSKIKHIINKVSNNLYYKDNKFEITIKIIDARDFVKTLKNIDIVYQDPFSVEVNSELWNYEFFKNIKKVLNKNGAILTYSVASNVRYTLYKLGFDIYEYKGEVRASTIATNKALLLKKIDLEHKKKVNPNLKIIK